MRLYSPDGVLVSVSEVKGKYLLTQAGYRPYVDAAVVEAAAPLVAPKRAPRKKTTTNKD